MSSPYYSRRGKLEGELREDLRHTLHDPTGQNHAIANALNALINLQNTFAINKRNNVVANDALSSVNVGGFTLFTFPDHKPLLNNIILTISIVGSGRPVVVLDAQRKVVKYTPRIFVDAVQKPNYTQEDSVRAIIAARQLEYILEKAVVPEEVKEKVPIGECFDAPQFLEHFQQTGDILQTLKQAHKKRVEAEQILFFN